MGRCGRWVYWLCCWCSSQNVQIPAHHRFIYRILYVIMLCYEYIYSYITYYFFCAQEKGKNSVVVNVNINTVVVKQKHN